MNRAILCVDDEPNILAAFERQLRKEFTIRTAPSGAAALERIAKEGPFAVILCDMRMPAMTGVELLQQVRQVAPDTVRIMLTGNADQQTAMQAINEGAIFRFLTKPCPPELLIRTVTAGLEQYRLVSAEKELLEQTLRGTITLLTEILELTNPKAFGRAARVRRVAGQLAKRLPVSDPWRLEVAAMLSQIGCLAVSSDALDKATQGDDLTAREAERLANHPHLGAELLAHIPRMEEVAEIVACQDVRFDGVGPPPARPGSKAIPLEARILKVALDFDTLRQHGKSEAEALAVLAQRQAWYDPAVLTELRGVVEAGTNYETRAVRVSELTCQMILHEDVLAPRGMRLLRKGQPITAPLLMRLKQFAENAGVQEPIAVLIPVEN